jgi:hypothetical protein
MVAALCVALAADLLQLPLTLAFIVATGSAVGIPADAPIEIIDIGIDVVTAAVTSWLLGFHWALLPTAVLEAIPLLDAAPTWTSCVLFVIWRRKREADTLRPGP